MARNGVKLSAGTRRQQKLGVITKGSLVEGLEMKLDPGENIEDMKAGKFVVIEGGKNDFFSMVTDMKPEATNADILMHPPAQDNELLREVLSGMGTYNLVALRPMLMMPKDADSEEGPRPVKAIPSHFSQVAEAEEALERLAPNPSA